MILANACPRCRGALSRVADIDEVYFSCVHCGYASYGDSAPLAPVTPPAERWRVREPADRATVRRRQIARERARAARRVEAA
ncbi:MAG: hypothetical protein M0R75_11140 [Dehalococcoidia bacterium]|nr:hypothetical protein [Dehalococcoidia bacterium]